MKKLILSLLALPLVAQAQMTYTGGPLGSGGICHAIWTKGDTALVGLNEGLYRTTDGGVIWELLDNGIPDDADPRTIEYTDGVLIVGTNKGSRIYTSTDFGDSFTGGTGAITFIAIPTASTSGPGLSMMGGTNFDPHTYNFSGSDWTSTGNGGITHGMRYMGGDTVWINSGSIASGTTQYSHDNGATWTAVTTEPQTDIGGGLIFTTKAQDFLKVGSRILVASDLNGFPVLYTDDYGTTWEAADLPSQAYSDYGTRFLRVNDNHLLTHNVSGIWKSTDQGETWTQIQTLPQIRTMKLWRNGHLLVGTEQGLCEIDNYGEGALTGKVGVPATATTLFPFSTGSLLAGSSGGLFQYDITAGTWTLVTDTSSDGQALSIERLAVIGDTVYAFTGDNWLTSGNGQPFQKRGISQFGYQDLSIIAELGGVKVAASYHTGFGVPQSPEIFLSTDNGASYTQAAFTNTVSYGLGGVGGNYVERFMETGNALVADMNAGLAISTDGGDNWTFTGSVWDQSFVATLGNDIYYMKVNGISATPKTLEVSSDNGATWTAVSLDGLPNSGSSNYNGYYGVWNLDGDLYTYNAHEAPRGIYRFDSSADQWELISGTDVGFDNVDGVTDLSYFDGQYYVNWARNGVWTAGGTISVPSLQQDLSLHVYPNPVQDRLYLELEKDIYTELSLYDAFGRLVRQEIFPSGARYWELAGLSPGSYILRVEQGGKTAVVPLIRQ